MEINSSITTPGPKVILGNQKTKFGFYQVGNRTTFSKIEAIEWQQQLKFFPQWNFNEDIFSSYNWKIEPIETLDELYARRARQIRDTYDYVVVCYSGGADSSNVLDTFVKNNIHVDEVLTINQFEFDSNPLSELNIEQTKVVYPSIQKLMQQGKRIFHRTLDVSSIIKKIAFDKKMLLERAYYYKCRGRYMAFAYLREVVLEYKKIIDSGQKLVFVWGGDKPRLYFDNKKFCIKFVDGVIDAMVNSAVQIAGREEDYHELFYWAPESVDIICKQGHILKRYFERQTAKLEWYSHFKNYPIINKLIYTNYNENEFSIGKIDSTVSGKKDEPLMKFQPYKQQMELIVDKFKNIDSYWWKKEHTAEFGLKGCLSPPYYLE